MKNMIISVALVLLIAGAANAAEYEVETVVEGLSFPWAIAFLPDGDMLVTERSGDLRRISGGELQSEPIGNVPEVLFGGQGGLMDIVLDPEFEQNQRLYLSFAHGTPEANATRVVSARLDGDSLTDIKVVYTASPTKDTQFHYGARIALLSDQTVLVTVGDGFDYRRKAQTLDNHFGKVVRVNKDGSVPSDNPFVGRDDASPEVWSHGLRNQQGLLVSTDGTVWLHEHGPAGGDELNIVKPGANYGWPAITYGLDYTGAYVSPFTEAVGMEQPVVHWTPSIAPGGFDEYNGDAFPDWNGNLFVAALAEKSVRRLVMKDGVVESQETLFTELDERLREVREGPDGNLYLLTDGSEGRLLRVSPAR